MAGKGRKPEGGVDWKKFRESPYWNKKKNKEDKHESNRQADGDRSVRS